MKKIEKNIRNGLLNVLQVLRPLFSARDFRKKKKKIQLQMNQRLEHFSKIFGYKTDV